MTEGRDCEDGWGKLMSESPTEHFEHAEHAEHVAHSGDPFLAKVSITIAALAVLAAAVGALETIETNDTIRDKTTAAIVQNKATDTWGEFSRQSIKKTMYDIAADGAADTRRDALTSKVEGLRGPVQSDPEARRGHGDRGRGGQRRQRTSRASPSGPDDRHDAACTSRSPWRRSPSSCAAGNGRSTRPLGSASSARSARPSLTSKNEKEPGVHPGPSNICASGDQPFRRLLHSE